MPLLRALALADHDEATRARLLALHEAAKAGTADLLAARLLAESDAFVREAAFTHLSRRQPAFAVEALMRLMGEGDTDLRNAAIETLGAYGEAAVPALAEQLASSDADMRIYALTALARMDCERAAEVALEAALKDQDENVCAAALDVVARSGVWRMAATLDRVAARFAPSSYVAFAARVAQQRLG